ncbi:MAG: tetratricopeptide repeat protein [bacterium]
MFKRRLKRFLILMLLSQSCQLFGQSLLQKHKSEVTQLRYQLGLEFIEDRDYEGALAQFRNILKTNSRHIESLRRIAEIHTKQRHFIDAILGYKNILQINPSDMSARNNLAQVYAWTGDLDAAEEEYKKVLTYDSTNVNARVGLYETYTYRKDYPRAIQAFEELVKRYPDNGNVLSHLAETYAWSGNYPSAIDIYRKLLKMDPRNREIRLRMAEVLSWQGNMEAAIKQYKMVVAKAPDLFEAYRGLAQAYAWNNNFQASLTAYQKTLELNPDDVEAMLGLADLYYRNGDYAACEGYLRQVLVIDPKNHQALASLGTLHSKGFYWIKKVVSHLELWSFIVIALLIFRYFKKYKRVFRHARKPLRLLVTSIPYVMLISVTGLVATSFLGPSLGWKMDIIFESSQILIVGILGVSFFAFLWILRFGTPVRSDTVLAIGAHPDDLEFGCGGTLLKFREEGARVIGLVLSRGTRGSIKGKQANRKAEAQKGASVLHLSELLVKDFPDTNFSQKKGEIREIIEDLVRKYNPNIILTHNPKDKHQDHLAVYQATKEAIRGPQTVLCYENPNTPSDFKPDYFVDISHYLMDKVQALKEHKSQMGKVYAKPEVVRNIAGFRGTQARVKYAEAYSTLKVVE